MILKALNVTIIADKGIMMSVLFFSGKEEFKISCQLVRGNNVMKKFRNLVLK